MICSRFKKKILPENIFLGLSIQSITTQFSHVYILSRDEKAMKTTLIFISLYSLVIRHTTYY